MAFAVAALVLSLLLPVTYAPDPCPDVHIIGVRGSGQSGYGEQVAGMVDATVEAVTAQGRSVVFESLPYPAISITDSFGLVLLNGDYERSVLAGVDALGASLESITASCPRSDLVLVGYSQGAQVIKRALEASQPDHRIASVVLLADPTRDPGQRGILRLGDPSVEREGSFGPVALPDHIRTVAIDVCAVGDAVCERGRNDLRAHIDGYDDAPGAVIPWLLADLAQRVASSSAVR
jgi:hypothetical protein